MSKSLVTTETVAAPTTTGFWGSLKSLVVEVAGVAKEATLLGAAATQYGVTATQVGLVHTRIKSVQGKTVVLSADAEKQARVAALKAELAELEG